MRIPQILAAKEVSTVEVGGCFFDEGGGEGEEQFGDGARDSRFAKVNDDDDLSGGVGATDAEDALDVVLGDEVLCGDDVSASIIFCFGGVLDEEEAGGVGDGVDDDFRIVAVDPIDGDAEFFEQAGDHGDGADECGGDHGDAQVVFGLGGVAPWGFVAVGSEEREDRSGLFEVEVIVGGLGEGLDEMAVGFGEFAECGGDKDAGEGY